MDGGPEAPRGLAEAIDFQSSNSPPVRVTQPRDGTRRDVGDRPGRLGPVGGVRVTEGQEEPRTVIDILSDGKAR